MGVLLPKQYRYDARRWRAGPTAATLTNLTLPNPAEPAPAARGEVGVLAGPALEAAADRARARPAQRYDSAKQLRYGHLMIMTDQDHDGSHIKGLIMNFLHHFYPSLLQVNGFLLEFITPIVKVRAPLPCACQPRP